VPGNRCHRASLYKLISIVPVFVSIVLRLEIQVHHFAFFQIVRRKAALRHPARPDSSGGARAGCHVFVVKDLLCCLESETLSIEIGANKLSGTNKLDRELAERKAETGLLTKL